MRRTLILIPHEILGIPVFGVGWLLMLGVLAIVIRLIMVRRRDQDLQSVLKNELPMWAVALGVIVFLLPRAELTNVDGDPVGMAVRGYGVMLLAGVASGVLLAAYRAKQRGINSEVIYSLVPWAFFPGIFGARLFFIIQYRDQFIGDTTAETIGNMLRFTEGGLVVYGSFIGGFLGVLYYVLRHRLDWLLIGDIIIPCLFIGLAFGRVGCLMNGCCYGARCEESSIALHFPPNSPVYQDQIRSGELLGMPYDPETRLVREVEPESVAAQAGIGPGSHLDMIGDDLSPLEDAPRDIPKEDALTGVIATVDGARHRWGPDELPGRALPVYPAQLISSFCGLLLCAALCAFPPFYFRNGVIMMLGIAGYAVTRFILELVREDEAGQFGTGLTISQLVSIVTFSLAMIGFAWVFRSSPPSSAQPQASSGN